MEGNVDSSPSRLEECRICHGEDEDLNMETLCCCRGSLKVISCNINWFCSLNKLLLVVTVCSPTILYFSVHHLHHSLSMIRDKPIEFDSPLSGCLHNLQQYNPGYIAPPPPPLFHYEGVPMNLRGNWEISATNLPSPRFIAMFTTDNDFPETDLDDYLVPSSRSLICARVVAIIFCGSAVLRYVLPIIISGTGDYSLTLFALMLLRTIAILFRICIMVKAVTAAMGRHRHRHHQDPRSSLAVLDEENDLPESQQQIQSRYIRVQ